MALTEERRKQNREAQARFREKREALLRETIIEGGLCRGLAAAVRRAVDHGRLEFRPILGESDEQTVMNLAEYLYQVPAKPSPKSPKLGKKECAG